MEFDAQLKAYQQRCEASLETSAARYFAEGSAVSEAAKYALLGGGKRVRGVLVLAVSELLGGDTAAAQAFAAALECIHAFSLVHDDLPCMDDDDLRRGKPATHIKFGEATALLAGDLLAIEAFGIIAGCGAAGDICTRAASVLAAASGAKGMILGQEMDLANEENAPDETRLLETLAYKTGALMRCAAALGAASAGLSLDETPEIGRYIDNIGLVFQIVDDILDVTSSAEVLGKPIGSDVQQGKTTYVTLFGIEAAKARVGELTDEACAGIDIKYGTKAQFLSEYAQTLARRIK